MRKAYDDFMTNPEQIISQLNFANALPLVIKAFFLSNLPCSEKKFMTMKNMFENAKNFLLEVSRDKPWIDRLILPLSSLDLESIRTSKIG